MPDVPLYVGASNLFDVILRGLGNILVSAFDSLIFGEDARALASGTYSFIGDYGFRYTHTLD